MFCEEKFEKLIRGGGVVGKSIRHSRVGPKFHLKMTLEFYDQVNIKRVFPN